MSVLAYRAGFPELATAALVLPVSVIAVLGGDLECNHLNGAVNVAVQGTPRASLCGSVHWDYRWLLVFVVPPTVTMLIASGARRRPPLLVAAWAAGAALALVPLVFLINLRAYPAV